MEDMKKFFETSGVIALRKTEFHNKVWNAISIKLPLNIDREILEKMIMKTISELDNQLFIGKEEKAKRMIDPMATIDKLKLDEKRIMREINKKIENIDL